MYIIKDIYVLVLVCLSDTNTSLYLGLLPCLLYIAAVREKKEFVFRMT